MNAPYLLIPIGLILLILYGISMLFSRLDILSKSLHRKIWNFSLLATFLVAAILGTLMAVQVNYKMEVSWTEIVLKWHVNFGIGMSVIGIFHLIWHWRYYFPSKSTWGIARRGGPTCPPVLADDFARGPAGNYLKTGGHVGPPLRMFLIGFIGIAFQTFMVRELLALFQGNELMLSIIMFLWLLITGAGALTGNHARKGISEVPHENQRKSFLLVLNLLILPFFSIPLMYYCKSLFFAPGMEAGPIAFAGFLLLTLAPFCFLNGFAFTFITRLLQSSGLNIRKAYAWESIGGAAAGIMCTLAIIAGILTPPAGRFIEKLYHPNDEIVATRSGSSGRITITRSGDQVNVFENGILVQSSGNTLVCEEIAHFAMIQHPDPRNVLVIGGLLSGIGQELSKYPCNRIDLAEPDPQVFRLAEHLNLIQEPILPFRYIRKNLSKWLHNSDIQYDIILVMLPGPQNLSLNRFYTAEFFNRLKNCMTPAGIVSVMLPGTANYVSDDAISAIGPVVNAMHLSFPQAILFPGENNYLIAGNGSLHTEILSELKSRNIPTLYVSDGYFDKSLFKARMIEINRVMESEYRVNTDLQPKAYFGQIAWWLGHFPGQIIWPLVAILILLVISGLVSRHSAFTGMFIMGAGASGIEIILIFLLQISAGSLYLFTGLLLAAFMGGLALGSMKTFSGRIGNITSGGTFILLAFTVVSTLLAILAIWMTKTGNLIGIKTALIFILTFVTASLTGLFFAHLTKILPDPLSGGKLYVYDMLGAAFGALVYPMVVIPIFGLLPAIGIISVSGVLILVLLKAGRN
ncbi:MAG: hypothetical protein NTV01_18710 [Bacteroidia bacterium]|nr:hypothetical protein [Bacteroidia bacterium]